jgi:hypothetical protein
MKDFFKDILKDKIITSAFFINVFLIITTVCYILIVYGKLPPFVPVFNQLPWGEQRLGPTITIFVPILVSVFLLAINIFISKIIYIKIPLISRMFAAISLLAGVLTFIFIIKTILSII